jgi:hypothetical protein
MVELILAKPWPPSVEVGREVPEAEVETDCEVSTFFADGPIGD